MRAILIGLFFLGLTSLSYAQVKNIQLLSEVEVYATNYNYLKSIISNDIPVAIKLLERKVAKFDVKSLNNYNEIYDTYKVLFFIPEGNISAWYDNKNNIIRTYEKFHDVKLPIPVIKSVLKTYPNWSIESDIYLVTYQQDRGANKRYKITLSNSGKRIKIKTDENGEIL